MSSSSPAEHPIVIITGMSGAGRTFTLKTMEDMGYDTVDNLPMSLMSLFISSHVQLHKPVAIGIDVRTHDFSATGLLHHIENLRQKSGLQVRVIFCDCDDDILARRFTETRRRHPLAHERPVIDGIRAERRLMDVIHEKADFILDTTSLSVVDCRRILRQQFLLPGSSKLTFQVMSFSYKQGIPRESDVVLDVRFLKNPHYDRALAPLSGLDAPVQVFLQSDPLLHTFIKHIQDAMALILPRFDEDGRSYITVALGCTGGQHRSVYCAQLLSEWLLSQSRMVTVRHRDLHKETSK